MRVVKKPGNSSSKRPEAPRLVDLHRRVHKALREFPRYNSFLKQPLALPLSLAESHVLVEAHLYEGVAVSELLGRLGIEKTILSKILNSLVRKRVVEVVTAPQDKRARVVRLLPAGQKILREFDARSNGRLDAFGDTGHLTKQDTAELSKALDALADGMGAGETLRERGEHELRAPIRRLTRAFQLLGRRALGSALNTLEWQILLTVCENSSSFLPSDLATLLSTSRAAMSQALTELESRKYISRKRDTNDRRGVVITPRAQGINAVRSIEQGAVTSFASWDPVTIESVTIIERWIRGAAVHFHLFQMENVVKPLASPSEIQEARRALLLYAAEIPERTFGGGPRNLGLFKKDGQLLAAVQFEDRPSKEGKHTIEYVSLLFVSEICSECARAFVAYSADRTLRTHIVVRDDAVWNVLQPGVVPSTLSALFTYSPNNQNG